MWIKGIDGVFKSTPAEVHGLYKVGDCVWVKNPNNQSTTDFKERCITGLISQHTVDGVSWYVRDLLPYSN